MGEAQPRIIDTIQAKLDTHILNENTFTWFHLIISDAHDKAIDTFVFASDDCLSKNDGVIGMASSVSDPELLGKCSWGMDCEFLGDWIVVGSGLHLGSVVSVAKLGETEASHVLQWVYSPQER